MSQYKRKWQNKLFGKEEKGEQNLHSSIGVYVSELRHNEARAGYHTPFHKSEI
jgi:hypothetical protein